MLLSRACDRWSQCDAYLEYLESGFRVHLSDKVQSLPHHGKHWWSCSLHWLENSSWSITALYLGQCRMLLCLQSECQGHCSLSSLHCDPWVWHLTWGDDIWHLMSPSLSHSLIINCHAHWHTCRTNQAKQAGYRFTNIHLSYTFISHLVTPWIRICLWTLIGFDTMSILFAFIRAVEDIWMPWFPLPCSVNK